jgi:hypothetical protein
LIETHNFAIKNDFVAAQMIGDRSAQFMEGLVFVTAAGHEPTLSTFGISECADPSNLFRKASPDGQRAEHAGRAHRFNFRR